MIVPLPRLENIFPILLSVSNCGIITNSGAHKLTSQLLDCANDNNFKKRVDSAKSHLKCAKLIKTHPVGKVGEFTITDRGRTFLMDHQERFTTVDLAEFEEYKWNNKNSNTPQLRYEYDNITDAIDTHAVYILENISMPGKCKIGKTTKSVIERARDCSRGTGVPTPFTISYFIETTDCHQLESAVHKILNYCRTNPNREFFDIPLNEAIKIIETENKKLETR